MIVINIIIIIFLVLTGYNNIILIRPDECLGYTVLFKGTSVTACHWDCNVLSNDLTSGLRRNTSLGNDLGLNRYT